MNVSVIIVSYNTRSLLKQCLESIYRNTAGLQYEVIVVDNNSADDSGKMVLEDFPAANLILNTENEGFAKANNRGFGCSRGDNLLFLNSDTIITNNALKYLTDYLQKHSAVGVVGPKLVTPDGAPTQSYQRFEDVSKLYLGTECLRHFLDVKKYRMHYPHYQFVTDREVEWLSGAALAIKRHVFEQVGKWDENYFLYYEDMDLCLQVKRAGYTVMYHPAAEIVHLFGRSARHTYGLKKIKIKSQRYYFKKNHTKTAYILAALYTILRTL